MYGLPWLLTGAILAHEVMHAWVAENDINCGHSDGHQMSAVGEGLAELLSFMWLQAQVPASLIFFSSILPMNACKLQLAETAFMFWIEVSGCGAPAANNLLLLVTVVHSSGAVW